MVAERSPKTYFDRACELFETVAALGSEDRYYDIGGHVVRCRMAGPKLVSAVVPALEHLAIEPAPSAALTVSLWDSASTATPPLPAPSLVKTQRLGRRGEIAAFNDDRFQAVFRVDANVFSMLDTSRNRAIFWTPDATTLPTYIRGAPLNFILNWWMTRRGLKLVHAGAVGTETGGVLLAGAGGCGKSSTALRCLSSNLLYAADDYCLVHVADPPHVYSLYSSAKLNPNDVGRFPELEPAISNLEDYASDKAVFMLHRLLPHKLTSGFPLRAIFLPRLAPDQKSRIVPISAEEALLAWMPSNVEQLPGAFDEAFSLLSELVRKVPTLRLELGSDSDRIPDVIQSYLTKG